MKTSLFKYVSAILLTVLLTSLFNWYLFNNTTIAHSHENNTLNYNYENPAPPTDTSNKVTLCNAISHINKYKTWWEDTLGQKTFPLAYTVDINDLIDALHPIEKSKSYMREQFQHHKIRAYMGIKEDNAHLYIVAVDKDGNDVIPQHKVNGKEVQYVYDLTAPCPRSCDEKSPLYLATPCN